LGKVILLVFIAVSLSIGNASIKNRQFTAEDAEVR